MAVYAIGDLQGCYKAFKRLLKKVDFSAEKDCLWVAGDLVSRGPDSLKVLRFIKDLGDSAICVLGNHDISLIAAHYGVIKPHDSLKQVMKAPDRDELIDWLRTRPLLHVDSELGFCMAHAGIFPHWNLNQALKYAREVEVPLRGATTQRWLENVYGDEPRQWRDSLQSYDRHRFILNAFTRMRGCDGDGSLNFSAKGTQKDVQLKGLYPWFRLPTRILLSERIIFGHWSALGYHQDSQVIALDTGCVWGRDLTAVRLDCGKVEPIQVSC
ncbi:symmetrical bis(5'-nucleosyl)-tetraphosphatase [Leucothrix sargassi]|nr:symmetrical bis(5'-nucleosyl)-tetraphosphatase [Leucothrix sargassi]